MKQKKQHSSATQEKIKEVHKAKVSEKTSNAFVPLFIVLFITFLVYIPVFNNQLTNWDDDPYVINNPYIKNLSIQNIITNFKVYHVGNYHPLSMLSLAVDYKIGGTNPWTYHLTNLILHLLNTLLVFLFTRYLILIISEKNTFQSLLTESKIAMKISPHKAERNLLFIIPSFTALMFGIATLNVESVAWVSERKNLLYACFFLLSCIMYIKYIHHLKVKYLIYAFLFFVLSLFSKGMAVSLTITLVAIDFVMQRKLLDKRVMLEKVPFLILSVVFGIIAVYAQRSTASIGDLGVYSVLQRICFASYGFVQYVIKLLIPFNLSAFYPYPLNSNGNIPTYFYSFPVIVICMLAGLYFGFKKARLPWFGFMFFVTNILLVIQIIPVGDTIMADRYAYVPCIGFFIIVGFFINKLWAKQNFKPLIVFFLLSIAVITSYQSFKRVKVWRNSISLWNDAILKFDYHNSIVHNNRGCALSSLGQYNEAVIDFDKAIEQYNTFSKAYINRAEARINLKDYKNALYDINLAIKYDSTSPSAFNNRGIIKKELGDFTGAIQDFNTTIRLDIKHWEAYYNRGNIYNILQKYQDAISDFNIALNIVPMNVSIYVARGQAFKGLNKNDMALGDFNKALELSPDYIAYVNRGDLKTSIGDLTGALNDYAKAIALNPNDHRAYQNRGVACFNNEKYREAISDMDNVLSLSVDNAAAYYVRGMSKVKLNMQDDGCADLLKSKKLNFSLAQEQYQLLCRGN